MTIIVKLVYSRHRYQGEQGVDKREFVIRPAQEKDAEAIAALMRDLTHFEGTATSKLEAEDVKRDGMGRRFRVLVAEAAKEAIGVLAYYPGYDLASASPGTHLADLFVTESWRGIGVGRALAARLARETLQEGGRWISWTVLTGNREGRLFYHRLGGQEVPVRFMAMGREKMRILAGDEGE
ncbi:MAG: GNAT family N-acetyltransferase [Alphaproteobacteria bacterium]|nr:GNAT family N-acetyltransferase [Alphaproteobacteria bacterium]